MPVTNVYHLVELKKQKTKYIDWKYDLLLEHSLVKSKFTLFPVDVIFLLKRHKSLRIQRFSIFQECGKLFQNSTKKLTFPHQFLIYFKPFQFNQNCQMIMIIRRPNSIN